MNGAGIKTLKASSRADGWLLSASISTTPFKRRSSVGRWSRAKAITPRIRLCTDSSICRLRQQHAMWCHAATQSICAMLHKPQASGMSCGVTDSLHGLDCRPPMQYRQCSIPPGSLINMSQRYVLYDPEDFPDPAHFLPKRWLADGAKALDKWLVVFSRGARNCIGQHVSWAELCIGLATAMYRSNLELYDTDRRDVDSKYDRTVPFAATDRGVRVLVK
jgi:hypothetical protein